MDSYFCKNCDYCTVKLSHFKRHLDSKKHLERSNSTMNNSNVSAYKKKVYICQYCKKIFASNQYMQKHQTSCSNQYNNNNLNIIDEKINEYMTKNLRNMVNDVQNKNNNKTNIFAPLTEEIKKIVYDIKNPPIVISNKSEIYDINEINDKPKKIKISKQKIPATLRTQVWDHWIGSTNGKNKCLCCNVHEITQLNFACGHILSESNGGKLTIENLKPICTTCNSSMGTQNMDEFIETYKLNIHKNICVNTDDIKYENENKK